MKTREKTNRRRTPSVLRAALLLVFSFVLLAVSATTYAWFTFTRRAAGITEIADPTAIFINAGNQEDIRYLNLGGINVESEEGYKDYVFCVRGNHVNRYKIQLSYTTNNQFDYEIFPATLAADQASVPISPESLVVYAKHDGTDALQYYYVSSGTSPITGTFLNLDAGATEKTALDSDFYHDRTYTPTGGSVYLHRHVYAIPLYWQSNGFFSPVMDANSDFCDFYILRVRWEDGSKNDKETDIIYISAKNVS